MDKYKIFKLLSKIKLFKEKIIRHFGVYDISRSKMQEKNRTKFRKERNESVLL